MDNWIRVRGARNHNLKNINVDIPRNKLVVITGLSGSGKSSLAFDTLYAEGQRRYVESLSAYARQFLDQMEKPDVDTIEGLSPAISIEQRSISKNPRSTVGTITEIYDYLRLLFARVGKPFCYKCGKPISGQTVQQMVDQILSLPSSTKISVLAPIIRGKKGEFKKELERLLMSGFLRVNIDGEVFDLDQEIELDKNKHHQVDVYIDRLVIKSEIRQRLTDSIETALKLTGGLVKVNIIDAEELLFSENFACVDCGVSFPEVTPRMFSFNSPAGACSECGGLGETVYFDQELIVPNLDISIEDGALASWCGRSGTGWSFQVLQTVMKHYDIPADVPYAKLKKNFQKILLYGDTQEIEFSFKSEGGEYRFRKSFEGIIPNLQRRFKETDSESMREELSQYQTAKICSACNGTRLRIESLNIRVTQKNIHDITSLSIAAAKSFFQTLELPQQDRHIAKGVLKEILERLHFLESVGLGYLSLDRKGGTLSGGEAQRIRLATQIGSALVGVMYILDEPSIGLHQRDNFKLIQTLKRLRDLGNTVIVVEHDEETISEADHIIDIGPYAGIHGGKIVVAGDLESVKTHPHSLTGQYLSGKRFISIPASRKKPKGFLIVEGAKENNLKNITVKFPLGVFCCVTGVSGSGKSTLVIDILKKALSQKIYHSKEKPGKFENIIGIENIDKIIDIDQSPIGRTPRSNPATYTGLFAPIRDLFSGLVDAKARGYSAGRFSFNVKGGRCEACQGDGILCIEMHFLPDVYVMCETCKGMRYNRETLEILYKQKNIAEVLEMTVSEALDFFKAIPSIFNKLQTLEAVGLGYIKLGQQATTLSGGEAQRIKLSKELSRRSTGKTFYILDEPTTGLHFEDIKKLLHVLLQLVEAGNTVLVIEHNLDVIKTADYIIDLGPEGGDAGGKIIGTGTPEEVSKLKHSFTGQYLKKALKSEFYLQN